jgi:hypothetical protein
LFHDLCSRLYSTHWCIEKKTWHLSIVWLVYWSNQSNNRYYGDRFGAKINEFVQMFNYDTIKHLLLLCSGIFHLPFLNSKYRFKKCNISLIIFVVGRHIWRSFTFTHHFSTISLLFTNIKYGKNDSVIDLLICWFDFLFRCLMFISLNPIEYWSMAFGKGRINKFSCKISWNNIRRK